MPNVHNLRFDTYGRPIFLPLCEAIESESRESFFADILQHKTSFSVDDFYDVLLQDRELVKNKPELLTRKWVANHFNQIAFKLACMERHFPLQLSNKYLTAERVMKQLKSRFQSEINESKRPPLRKILNRDCSSTQVRRRIVSPFHLSLSTSLFLSNTTRT